MEFAEEFPTERADWYKKSNSIIILAVKNEQELWKLADKLKSKGFRFSKFFEPDIGDELTALAIVPSEAVKRALSSFPLLGNRKPPEDAQEVLNKKFDLIDAMNGCYQHSTQTMYQHGVSVREHMFKFLDYIQRDIPLNPEWKVPFWLEVYKMQLARTVADDFTVWKYTTWHDCGKPFVKTVDEQGKSHYPDHATISAEKFAEVYKDLPVVTELIRRDMGVHKLKTEEVELFCRDKTQASTLLLSGLAELYANSKLFGGTDTESFKIKFKHLEKKGMLVCKHLFPMKM